MRDFYTKENMQGATFHIPDEGLIFEPAELSFETEAETGREGVIRVRHVGGKPARGYVYPSERCMRGVREQFAPAADGTGYIRWQFDSRGIAPGRTVSGYFRVISPFGEYSIPYRVRVSGAGVIPRKKPLQTRGNLNSVDAGNLRGKRDAEALSKSPDRLMDEEADALFSEICSKRDFLELADRDFELAVDFFYSNRFPRILTEDADRTLYRGLSMLKNNRQNVEEFLIAACGKKKTIFEPVDKSLFLQTEGKAGRTDSRMAGTRAERALEAHRQRVRSRGLGGGPVRQQQTPQDDLIYIPLQIRKIGTGHLGLTIQAEGRFLPSAPFAVPAEFPRVQQAGAAGGQNSDTRQQGPEADLYQVAGRTGLQSMESTAEKAAGRTGLPGMNAGSSQPAGRTGLQSMGSTAANSADRTGLQSMGSTAANAVDRIPGQDPAAGKDMSSGRKALSAVFGKEETGEPECIFTVRIPVNRAALHTGRNFGRVIVRGPFNETEVPVEVHSLPPVPTVRRRQERELHLLELQLMRLYVDFRLTDTRAHADLELQADRMIDEIASLSHRDLIPRLYRVHMLIMRGQKAEAERELSRISVRYAGTDSAVNFSARFTGEQEDAYCYRQYLYARCREEDVQLRSKVVRFLKSVYRAKASWQTAWMLMDLAEEYAPGTGARWNFLRHQYENGCNSPVIWIDAWEMVKEDPRILLPGSSVQERWVKDDFGLLVLWYAARNNVLTDKAAEVMISLAEKKKTFSPLLYRALCSSLEVDALAGMRAQLLRALCILLIRGQDISPRAHGWYKRALEESVSLTNLEEYCQRSTPPDDSEFRLPAGCNALLRTTAPRACMAVLIYDRFRREQVFPIKGGVAPMSVYGDANTIFLEDVDGCRYAASLPFAVDLQEKTIQTTQTTQTIQTIQTIQKKDDIQKKDEEAGEKKPGSRQEEPPAGPGRNRPGTKTAARPVSPGGKSFSDNAYELALQIGYGEREKKLVGLTPEKAEAAGRLLDSGLLTTAARTELLLLCLESCRRSFGDSRETAYAGGKAAAGTETGREGVRDRSATGSAAGIRDGSAAGSAAGARDRSAAGSAAGGRDGSSAGGNDPLYADEAETGREEEYSRFFLQKADPAQCSPDERALLLRYLEESGEYERAVRWLLAYGSDAVDSRLLGRICLGLPWENGYETAVIPLGWEAFLRGNTDSLLLERLSAALPGLSEELRSLRKACVDKAVPTRELDTRIVRQTLFSGAVSQDHARMIVSQGDKLGDAFLPALAQYSDFAFSGGFSMGNRMTELVAATIAEGRDSIEDICRIACLKELSIRQGEFTQREKDAAAASLSVLLSKGIIFPFYRQFPGYDDRLDLYAEETLVQYHSLSLSGEKEKHITFHYTTSRRGETGNYRSRPMKEMYRNFFVSGFLLFYGEQMHYYITDDPQEKHVVQSGMIGQDARILENCSGRFGLINETTRAAALRDYDEALSLLTGYYRRSYLENELFRH